MTLCSWGAIAKRQRRWLTPETTGDGEVCRPLSIPNDLGFLAAVTGALSLLGEDWNWEKSGAVEPAEAAQLMRDMVRNYSISDCVTSEEEVEAPFWDDTDGEDADDEAPPDEQDWYGVWDGETFLEALSYWAVTAFLATGISEGAAIEFITPLRTFRLTLKRNPHGAKLLVFMDSNIFQLIDLFSPTEDVVTVDVVSPGSTLMLVHSGDHNASATPDENGNYTVGVVKSKLTEWDVVPIGTRYSTDDEEVQFSPDGGTTWNPAPNLDPRNNTAYLNPPVGGADPQCLAAGNMVDRIKFILDTTIESAGIFQAATGVLNIVLLLLPGAGTLLDLILAVVTGLFTIGVETVASSLTETVYDDLLTMIYCKLGTDGQISEGNFAGLQAKVNTDFDVPASTAILYALSVIGFVGLNNAGTIGESTRDCSAISCTDWPRQFDLCGTDDSWTVVYGDLQADGVHSVDSMGGWPSVVRIERVITIPAGSEINEVWFWGLDGTGANNRFIVVWNGSVIVDITNPGAGAAPFKTTGHHLTGSATMIIEVVKNVTGSALRIPAVRLYGTGVPPAIGHDIIDPPTCV